MKTLATFRNITLFAVVFYILLESLILSTEFGVLNFLVLVLYFLLFRREEYRHKNSFMLSILFIMLALLLFLIDNGATFDFQTKKFSEWAYFFIVIGILQLVLGNADKIKKTKPDSSK